MLPYQPSSNLGGQFLTLSVDCQAVAARAREHCFVQNKRGSWILLVHLQSHLGSALLGAELPGAETDVYSIRPPRAPVVVLLLCKPITFSGALGSARPRGEVLLRGVFLEKGGGQARACGGAAEAPRRPRGSYRRGH